MILGNVTHSGEKEAGPIDITKDPKGFTRTLIGSVCSGMKLSDDPSVRRRFRLPYEMTPAGYFPNEILDIIESARKWLQDNGMPKELKGNPFYRHFIARDLTQEDIDNNRALIFLPRNPDIENVMVSVRLMAKHIIDGIFCETENKRSDLSEDEMRKAENALSMALYFSMVMSVNDFDIADIFRIDIYHPNPKETKREFVSAFQIRDALRTLEKEFADHPSDRRDAVIYLMYNLRILNHMPNEESEKSKIKLDVQRSMEIAWEIYESIGTTLEGYRNDFGIDGEAINLEPNARNKTRDIYELLEQVFIKANSPEIDLKFVQEAQTIATIAYLVHRIRKHPLYMKTRECLNSISSYFMEEMFGSEEEEPENTRYAIIYMDGKKNILPIDERGIIIVRKNGGIQVQTQISKEKLPKNYQRIIVRKLKNIEGLEEVGEQEVHYQDLHCKKKESILMRLLTKRDDSEGSIDIEDLPDMLRGRFVLMNIRSSDISDQEKGAKVKIFIENLAKKVGHSMQGTLRKKEEMKYKRHVDKRTCKPGEFTIKDKLNNTKNQKGVNYRAMKVYGRTFEGVRFEFQIIPRDTFEMSHSPKSPNHHKYYDLERTLEIARIIFRRSIHPRVHEVIDGEFEYIEALKRVAVDEYQKIIEDYLGNI